MNQSSSAPGYTAILPIKFNSERLPAKNFKSFLDQPLFSHVLNTLNQIEEVSKIVINTDAPESIFGNWLSGTKAELSIRPDILRGETISMNSIIEYEISQTESQNFFMTHTTNPLLRAPTIESMLSIYEKRGHDYDSVVAVTKFFGRFLHQDGTPMNHEPSSLLRTQDLKPVLFENSCGYVFSRESFFSTKSRIGAKPLYFETPKLESVDIDEEADWIMAEALGRFGRDYA